MMVVEVVMINNDLDIDRFLHDMKNQKTDRHTTCVRSNCLMNKNLILK